LDKAFFFESSGNQTYNLSAIIRFEAANDTLVHWLQDRRRIWWQKDKLHVGQIGQRWMSRAVVDNESNFSTIYPEFRSTLRTHSSKISLLIQLFFCDVYWIGRCLIFLKHRGLFDFPITNIGNFSPFALAAAIPVNLTLLFFPPGTLFSFEVIGFIWETLVEKTELVSIENIFQLIV